MINRGLRYWQIVGLTEDFTEMLPMLLALVYSPRSRKHLLLAGLTILAVMFTHGLQDLFGKYIGPLAIGVLGQPLLAIGITEESFQPGQPLF